MPPETTRQKAPGRLTLADQRFKHAKASATAPTPSDRDALINSDYVLPRTFWMLLAKACCRARKEHKDSDVMHAAAKDSVPVAYATAQHRFTECISAQNRLRRKVAKVEKAISSDGMSLIKSKENVKEAKLLPSRDYTKKSATSANLKAFATTAAPLGVVRLKNARDRIQILALTSGLSFSGARPGFYVVAAGYDHDDSTLGLQWEACEFFFPKLGYKVQPGIRVTLRNLKCRKQDQKKFRRVVFLARNSLPAAANSTVLLYTLALTDGALEDVERVADVQASSSAEMNTISNRVDLEIKPELMELAVFRRIEQAGPAAPWVTSDRPLNVDLADKVFGKIRPYCCPSLVLYDFRRGAAAALNRPGISCKDAKLGMGHCTGSEVRASAYLPKTAAYDLTGLLVEGVEDRETVQWLGNDDLPYAPLTNAEEAQLRLHPDFVRAAEEKAKAHDCVTAKYHSVPEARG